MTNRCCRIRWGGKRSLSIVIHEETTYEVYSRIGRHQRTRNFHAVYQNGPFSLLSFSLSHHFFSFLDTDTRAFIYKHMRANVLRGICDAKLAGTKVINYALDAMAMCNNKVVGAHTPVCTIISPDRFSSQYFCDDSLP